MTFDRVPRAGARRPESDRTSRSGPDPRRTPVGEDLRRSEGARAPETRQTVRVACDGYAYGSAYAGTSHAHTLFA